jgi:hypothetical protein
MVEYSISSPYYTTALLQNRFLDIMTMRDVPARADDVLVAISPTYDLRPDLMAYDLYGTSGLWWVFSVRNPDIIKDPIWDHNAGTVIYLPQGKYLRTALGG